MLQGNPEKAHIKVKETCLEVFCKGSKVSDTTVFENHKKVSYNIASEASSVYILSGQKFIKNAKIGRFWRVFKNLKLAAKQYYQTGHFK